MKTVSLVILLTTGTACLLHAQEQPDHIKPDNSLKMGVVLSSFTNTDLETGLAPGFAIGLALDFKLTGHLSVQPEVNYMEKGGKVTDRLLDTEFELTMDYIEVPLLAKYRLPGKSVAIPNLFAGPYAGFLIENNSNIEVLNDGRYSPDDLVTDAAGTDFGLVLGAGAELDFKFNTMTAEIRYTAGVSSAFGDDAPGRIRNGTFAFLIGFHF